MSIGLKYLATAIANGAGSAVLKLDEELLHGEPELAAISFAQQYYRSHREAPTPAIVLAETGVRLPAPSGALNYHLESIHERFAYNVIRDNWAPLRGQVQDADPAAAIETMSNIIRRTRSRRHTEDLIDIHQGMDQVIERLQGTIQEGGLTGVPTRWPTFDDQTGGLQPSDLITVVARSGMGKTNLLLDMAECGYQSGSSILFVTSEMGSEQIARRWMAMRFGLSSEAMKKGTVSTHLLRRMRGMRDELLGRERFRLLSVGTGARMSRVEEAIAECSPDAVYLDGVYLFSPAGNSGYMSRTDKVSKVFDEAKQLTIDSKIPLVVTTQFNRGAGTGGKEGTLETIGLSDTIGWHSSIVLAVKPGPTENPKDSRELDVLKGREGEEASFAINFKFKPVDFSEMTREQMDELAIGPAINTETDWT